MSTDPRTEPSDAQEAMRDALPPDAFSTIWREFNAAYQEFRDRNPGWQAFYTDHHQYALDAALKALATVLDLPARDARYARELAKVHGVWDEAVAAGRTAAAADLPSSTDEIVAWLSRHGLSTTPGVGVVLAAARRDILGICSACGPRIAEGSEPNAG